MIKKITSLLILLIPIISESQVTYIFESGSLSGWLQVPDARWAASSVSPINGSYSLKHIYNNTAAATDRSSIALPSWNPSSGIITWQVKVRHGYDPSASNRWWIYLMSDQDANQMQSGGASSGYAIGVNLTGSDDLLKLWRFDNGTPSIILTSTLNWQTQITTAGIGAIEVERKVDGTFTLKASTSGSFSSLTNYGSVIDFNHLDFNYFGICYSYTSSADMLLWVDDIAFNFSSLNNNDLTSEVIAPTTQINADTILSTSNNQSDAIDIFKFQIRDKATSDIQPTRVKSLSIKRSSSSNSANWINSIGGFKLRDESGDVTILNQTITSDKITIAVDSTSLIIQNGQTKEYTLSIYLKPDNLVDGSTIKMMIDSAQHGFEAGLSGSDFSSIFPHKIISNEFKINVEASALKIIQSPETISKNTPFSLSVGGADDSGNLDMDFSGAITLSLSEGSGILSSVSGLTKPTALGLSTWTDLIYNDQGTLLIQATSPGLNSIETEEIQVLNDTTSVILLAPSQPDGSGISSLKTYPSEAVELLRFRISDTGDTDDLPTIVENLKISRTEIANAATLSKVIGGIIVKVNGNPIGISEPDIKTSYFTFSIGNNNLVIPNGSYVDVSLFIYLKDAGLTDNQKIQLKVDSTQHGSSTDPTGSAFKTSFPQKVASNIFSVNVVASKIKFSSVPTRVGVLEPFSVTLAATDVNGNTDKDFSGSVDLSLLTGDGELDIPSGSTTPITQGSCTFDSITYSIPEKFSLLASCLTLNNIASPLIICGDSDGGVIATSTSASPVFVNSTVTSPQDAVEILKLKVFDGGSTDGLPLFPSKISLHCFDPSKAEQLNRQIAGFALEVNDTLIEIESYSLINGIFEIIPRSSSIYIADNDTATISIRVYVNKNEIKDNFSFRFYIPSTSHGWEASSNGTGFASSFVSAIYGPECKIKVDATGLRFIEAPFTTIPSQQFRVKVCAVDINSNVDDDFSDQLTLSLAYGTGNFSCSNIHKDLNLGSAEWNDVSFDRIGTYRLNGNGVLLDGSTTEEIYCGLDPKCLIQEDFETSLNPNWVGLNDWLLSTISPLNGSKSLQQKQSSISSVSSLSIPVNFPLIGDELIEWSFTLKNGNWAPSSDNYFYFALMADSSDLKLGSNSGYFVGVNPGSGYNLVTLWKSDKGVKTSLITTSFSWVPNIDIKIKVDLTPRGEWRLWYKPNYDQSFVSGGNCIDILSSMMDWCGLVFGYTSTRSGLLWMDDLSVCTTDYPPVLKSAKPLNLNTIKVDFSEEINFIDAAVTSNYSILDKDSVAISIISTSTSNDLPNEVILKTDQFPFGRLILKEDGIKGLNGQSIKDSIYFGLGEKGTFGRLVINEIMANPEPVVGLPNVEYIELYNPTTENISLSGWKIQANSTFINIPNDTIHSNQYAVLCSTSAATELSYYGKSIGVTSFPSLLNAGMSLKLFDSGGSLISMVSYSDSWYGDDLKTNGGWSLEKIDYQNLMEGKSNWRASLSPNGGTPCAANSVAASNPDIIPPRILSIEVTSDTTILLQFSEPMDSLMITFPNNYNIDNGIEHPVSAALQGGDYSTVILKMSEPISASIKYSICLNVNITDFLGNQIESVCLPFALPQVPIWNDIAINEVLFNPNTGGVDFVELYNRSDKCFDLSKMFLSNRNSITNELDQVNSASDTARLFFPDEYAVITISSELVKKFYHTENDNAFVNVSKMSSYNNDLGSVVLLNKELDVIDEMHYSDKMHSKLLSNVKGVSLERINPNLSSSSTSTWQSAAQTAGFATPTYKNSQWVEPAVKEDEFTLSPETFSPDGDGWNDYLLISYKLPVEGSVANIRVFSPDGREVRRLASNLLIGTEGTLTWDGLDSKNRRVPIGIYIVYIEYFNPNGDVKKYKKTCVVAEKL